MALLMILIVTKCLARMVFFKFGKFFWHILKADTIALFHNFHSSGEFDPKFSESFIYLIPKVKSSASINDLRVISLLGCVHKLIVKILIARLKSVIDQLFSHTQTAFIRGRSIHDG